MIVRKTLKMAACSILLIVVLGTASCQAKNSTIEKAAGGIASATDQPSADRTSTDALGGADADMLPVDIEQVRSLDMCALIPRSVVRAMFSSYHIGRLGECSRPGDSGAPNEIVNGAVWVNEAMDGSGLRFLLSPDRLHGKSQFEEVFERNAGDSQRFELGGYSAEYIGGAYTALMVTDGTYVMFISWIGDETPAGHLAALPEVKDFAVVAAPRVFGTR
jgi:hypothetical protein